MTEPCIILRRVISHYELDALGILATPRALFVQHINEMRDILKPFDDHSTRVQYCTINGEPHTLIEMRA